MCRALPGGDEAGAHLDPGIAEPERPYEALLISRSAGADHGNSEVVGG